MGNDRSGKKMGATAKSYSLNWYKSQIFNRNIEIKSKYLAKGNIVELESIFVLNEYLCTNYEKNDQHFENDYMTGTPDIIANNCIIDIKNSWDWLTFPFLENEPDPNYYLQLQGYMELTGKREAKLIYILSDTPEYLIEREAYNYAKYQLGEEELSSDIYDEFVKKMTYNDIPIDKKIKVFDFAYNDNIIKTICSRVIEIREFLKTI